MDKVKINNINLFFGEKQVLKNVNMEVQPNEVVALIGPSGCGKSTLLRCINRMHDTDAATITGDIYLDGKNIFGKGVDVNDIRHRIGMVFQRPNPFPKSIASNIAYGLKINGVRDKEKIEETIELSLKNSYLWEEVGDKLKESALSLSGGQQQRLCIARCIAVSPDVILMDEPTSALDPISTRKIEDLILKLKKDYTVIIVTHNMQQARRIADRVAFMYLGDMVEYTETKKFFEDPDSELAQKYIKGEFG